MSSLLLSFLIDKNYKRKYSDDSNIDVSRICRVCCKRRGVIRLFNNVSRPNIITDIFSFSGVMISKTDDLSKYLCKHCMKLLDDCKKFRRMCKKSYDFFTKLKPKVVTENIHQTDNRRVARNTKVPSMDLTKKTIKLETVDSCEDHDIEFDCYIENDFECPESNSTVKDINPARDYKDPRIPDELFPKRYQCKICIKKFMDYDRFIKHQEGHEPSVLTMSNKRKYIRRISVDHYRSTLCDICGKTCGTVYQLKEHMLTHADIFPFQCGECPYKSRTRGLLVTHMRSHIPEHERPYKCPHCDKRTSTSGNLRIHVTRVHCNERRFKCTYCEKAFKSQNDMMRHINVVHLNQRTTVQCYICYKSMFKKYLRRHLKTVHKLELEKSTLPNRLPTYILHARKAEASMNETDGVAQDLPIVEDTNVLTLNIEQL